MLKRAWARNFLVVKGPASMPDKKRKVSNFDFLQLISKSKKIQLNKEQRDRF